MKITLFEKEYEVGFCMATQVKYEEMSGQPFDPASLDTQKATMQLCYAALEVSNGTLPFTFDEMNKKLTVSETGQLKNAVITEMTQWFEIPAVMEREAEPQEEGDGEKND